jgi:hypothetical protein
MIKLAYKTQNPADYAAGKYEIAKTATVGVTFAMKSFLPTEGATNK